MSFAGHAPMLAQLLPPVSYDPNAARMATEIDADGRALDQVFTRAKRIAMAADPAVVRELLPEWEVELGLPPRPAWDEVRRLARVLAKLLERGGLSRAYFIKLAAALGVQIEIVEPAAPYIDDVCAGDWLYDRDSTFCWTWRVIGSWWWYDDADHYAEIGVYQVGQALYWRGDTVMGDITVAEAGTAESGDLLSAWGDPAVWELFEELKPAHTWQNAIVYGGLPLEQFTEFYGDDFDIDDFVAGLDAGWAGAVPVFPPGVSESDFFAAIDAGWAGSGV